MRIEKIVKFVAFRKVEIINLCIFSYIGLIILLSFLIPAVIVKSIIGFTFLIIALAVIGMEE